ncbi:translation initiation factor SU [Aspergillus lucknowensis]|uniref:Translation initiation factor SU n=1 Tax=Aspergillus lucknowensis TaxID=176173 RepID=A0ABR4LNB3_9EURO
MPVGGPVTVPDQACRLRQGVNLGPQADGSIQDFSSQLRNTSSKTGQVKMTSKKDMRRLDLAIPYVDPPKDKSDADMTGAMSSTMPMAAMFMRNRMIGWVAFVFSLQSWLGETAEQKRTATTPAYMSVLMSHPFAEADEDTGETKQSQNYIHIRIQQRNGRKTLTTVQGLPKKFDQKKILKVIKKKFACNGTIVNDTEMGEVIQLQGDQRKDVQEFLTDKKEGLELDAKTIKVHGF